jgi:hypothetical protein
VAEYYERYGFTANPFALRPFDPLQRKDADDFLVRDIDGFSKLMAVGEYLRDRAGPAEAPLDRPAFVLITGSEKAGLSSAANEVLSKYRQIRNLQDRFTSVQIEMDDHSELRLYRRWVSFLYNRLRGNLNLAGTVATSLYNARKLADPDTLDVELQSVVADLLPALKAAPGAAFGSCLEKIKTQKVIEIALIVFENFPTVCVFTAQAGAFDVDKFTERHPEVHALRLGYLNSEEARKLLEKKWGTASNLPFHLPTLGNFCEKNKHSIGVVLTVAERLLKRRVRVYEDLHGNGSWPGDARLGFSEINTLELLQSLEVLVNGGN